MGASRLLELLSAKKKKKENTVSTSRTTLQCQILYIFYLLLGTELVGVATLSLTAVSGTRGKTSVALAADVLLAVVLGGELLQRGLNDTTTETEHKVKGRLLLNVVVRKGAAVLELLASENQTLLVRGNAFITIAMIIVSCQVSIVVFTRLLQEKKTYPPYLGSFA
ncbi:hypothetical protein BCR43DRAFT_359393 [Syncephalastrum racemosum]|uniref:Uncharacterized protein n=1 Tax=Syncephalastrum racemosum TaxID=13706 RepID=A0A1X2H6Z4_SYNRA|nr:hypothetical protein BCR43DRAFT_359393 [Syncephalastrum racemosum]